MKMITHLTLMLLTASAAQAQAAASIQSVDSDASARQSCALTVYNDDLALVRERRLITLPAGQTRLNWREVSGQIRPETALLQTADGSPVTLLEQNFDYDLLSPQKLLDKYVGQDVTVIRQNPASGAETREKATVLSTHNGTVLRFADRIETGVPGRIAFDRVPSTLRERPTLSILLDTPGGRQALELSYLTTGLSWQADYVANLSADGRRLDLSGWVTLRNHSGAAYQDARLQLVAGNVHRVAPPQAPRPLAMAALAARGAEQAVQESLMDYHLYSFQQPTSIADQQTKQLALLSASAVPVRREYLLTGAEFYYRQRDRQTAQTLKPAVFVEFDNRGGTLGIPLPAGVVRVYSKDSRGAAQFVGEDRIEHTARNETVRLRLGDAFDISAQRQQTEFRKLSDTTTESAYRIELRNARDEAVQVRVREPMPGDWELLRESQASQRDAAHQVSWLLNVPAGGKTVLEYAVRVRW